MYFIIKICKFIYLTNFSYFLSFFLLFQDIDIGDELIAKGFAVSDEKQDSIKIKQESSSGKNLIEQTSNSEVNGKLNNLKLNLNLDIDTSP